MDIEGFLVFFGGWIGMDFVGLLDDVDLKFIGFLVMKGMVESWSVIILGSDNVKWIKVCVV